MSTSGRYQSRLFSFFSQQSLRLKDKTAQAWRQVKLAAVWSTQVALYPIYALFQTGRLLGRQMGQATRQVLPRLRAVQQQILNPSEINSLKPDPLEPNLLGLRLLDPLALFSDTPIQNLLAKNRGEKLTSLIQGFASLLTNRGLVLVTTENEILDVLTEEQQMQLQRQMIWEMASYWQYRKTQLSLGDRTQRPSWTNTFLPLPKERANLLPPIRAFRRLMTWIQLSPVAIAVNLFQESRLTALPSPPEPILKDSPLRSAQLPGSRVDQLVRNLLKERLLKERLLKDRSPQPLPLIVWVKRQVNGLAELSKSLGSLLQNSSIVLYDPLPKSEPEDFSLVSPTLSQPLPQTPWSKIEDFFGGEFSGITGSRQIVERGETAVQGAGAREAIAGGSPEGIAPADSINDLTMRSLSSSALNQFVRNDGGIAPTLLEAEVTGVSYERHPLERLLKWLDQGMLWIEQKLGQVWHWLHRL